MVGIQDRLYSHAYVAADPDTGKRIVFVSADMGAIFQSVRVEVVKELRERYGETYTGDNVMLTATHTHVGNSGQAHATLYPDDPAEAHRCHRAAGRDGQLVRRPPDELQQGLDPPQRRRQGLRALSLGGEDGHQPLLWTNGTFLQVQRRAGNGWRTVLTDRDWDTTYTWEREGIAASRTTVEWRISEQTPPGTYRLVQQGDWKNGWTAGVKPYRGVSQAFTVR